MTESELKEQGFTEGEIHRIQSEVARWRRSHADRRPEDVARYAREVADAVLAERTDPQAPNRG